MNYRRVLGAGLIASVVMGMLEMLYEWIWGDGFWSPVTYIGATVLRRLQALVPPVGFDFWGVVFGLAGHMMNSVILGLIFVRLFSRSVSRNGLVALGVLYGVAIFVVMWYVIVPAIDPVMLNLNGGFFFITHLMWGVALGLIAPAREDVASQRVSPA